MSTHYNKLITKLRELFELDKADLDFGIYRIIGQRQTEITQFLEHDLKRHVQDILRHGEGDQRESSQRELDAAIKSMQDLGMEPSASPKVKELEEKLSAYSGSEYQEIQTYEHLYRFFSRYYEEGDFISQRRVSKDAKYAIPYNGEEVKLHWANADQYYIKSSENFRDYRFKLGDGRFVNFKLQEAQSSRDNTKGDKRFFMLADEAVTELDNGELQLGFYYQGVAADQKKMVGADGKEKTTSQKVFNELALQVVDEQLTDTWQAAVFAASATKANPKRTLLEKHLNDYTAKNSFDYFIHKDLGGFLRRELDFYIKNEVMELDDVVSANADKLGEMLQQIKAIRRVADLVISFLAQLENFQRKLWLKKKFVVKSDYCFTLDRLPESLYGLIAGNDAQRQEWVELGFIADDAVVDVAFLAANPFLLVDTRFFEVGFKYDCLSHIDGIDEQCDGLLIHGDNFQALNLLQERYREKVKCIYIDPPYNTDASAIIYKNGYKNSSWLSLINDRLERTKPLAVPEGILCFAIDDEELFEAKQLIASTFQKEVGTAVVRSNPQSRKSKDSFSPSHEYALFYSSSVKAIPGTLEITQKKLARYPFSDEKGNFAWMNFIRTGNNDKRSDRPKLYYPIFVHEKDSIRVPKMTWSEVTRSYLVGEQPLADEVVIYPNKGEIEKNWHRGHLRVSTDASEYRVRRDKDNKINVDFKTRLDESSTPVTWWDKSEYASANYGAAELKALFTHKQFDFPKARKLVEDCLRASGSTGQGENVLDYFAGSGTTAHAVINLNREDNGQRKYILVEQGEYFNTVLKPRVKKVAYAEHWKDGKPITHKDHATTDNPLNGVSHCFKTLTLESYEDTQNNLQLNRTGEQQKLLEQQGNEAFKQDYTLNYMLDIESKGSLLNIQAFEQPFNYQMHIATDSAGETRCQNIDLIETFNYLIGLTVHTLEKTTVHIPLQQDNDGIWQLNEKIRPCEQGQPDSYTFLIVSGQLPNDDSTLVIWRALNDFAHPESKMKHNMALDTFVMDRLKVNPKDKEIDAIFVNGDNTLPNIRSGEEHWKVRLIEEEFQRLMFLEA